MDISLDKIRELSQENKQLKNTVASVSYILNAIIEATLDQDKDENELLGEILRLANEAIRKATLPSTLP